MIASASYTMRSAVLFLPSSMTLLITWVTRRERWTGSGSTGRMVAAERRGMKSLLLLDAVLATALLSVGHARGGQRAAPAPLAHAPPIPYAAAPHQHDRGRP